MDNLCWVGPADEKGNVDNLLTRVARLEEIIAQLMGSNINALQLADITPRVGVVTDMTAISSNAAGGWITDGSFTGVGISTLGWKMSDGSTYPIVQMVNGALQYGFNQAGGQTGTRASGGELIGIGEVSGSQSFSPAGTTILFPLSTVSGTMIVPSAGDYLITWNAQILYSSAAGQANFTIDITSSTSENLNAWDFGIPASFGSQSFRNSGATVFQLNAGEEIKLYGSADSDGAASTMPYARVAIVKLI